jgi:hypothetical protein
MINVYYNKPQAMNFQSIKYVFLAILILGLAACYKDLGNYDYTEPNRVSINGIEEKYTAYQGSYLEIIPQLTFTEGKTGDSARYKYEWFSMKWGALVGDKRRDLGTNLSLRTKVALPTGTYNIYYRVTDTLTGIMWQKSFDLEVVSDIYEGWMVMAEVNGAPRLDMINKDKVTGAFKVLPDVLATVGSALTLKGKPLKVNCFRFSPLATGYGIYLSTDKTTDRIDAETFQYTSTLNIKYEMLSNVPETFAPHSFADAGGYRNFMMEGTDMYYYNYVNQIRYGLPINIMKGETVPFQVAPFIATSTLADATCLYDLTNKRFVRHVSNDANCGPMPTGTLFDFNTGKDLVYMTFTAYDNGSIFAILHDQPAGKYYLARFVFGNNIQQVYYEEMTATDMAQAKNFAVSPNLGYIFYSVGGKLYSYDMSLKASKLMIDKGNQSFTLLQFRGNTLMAGSVDPAKPEGANGTLESYNVQPIQGPLELVNSWSGIGKIISISYRTR